MMADQRASISHGSMTHEFCDHCPGCRPAIVDLRTGKIFPEDSPAMQAVNRMWNTQTSYAERKAYIDVTVHNSRKTQDLMLAARIVIEIEKILKATLP